MISRPLSDSEKAFLGEIPLFAALGKDRLAHLVASCRVETVKRGSHLFRAADRAEYFYVLLSGQLRLVRTSPQGTETVMHFLTSPGAFAEAVTLAGRPYPVDCEVMADGAVVAIPRAAYLKILQEFPEVAGEVMAGLLEWERFFLDEIYRLRHTSPLQRIAAFLIDHQDHTVAHAGDKAETGYPEKRQIASRIGITPETFSRLLRRLEQMNAIETGASLRIRDRGVLENLARFS